MNNQGSSGIVSLFIGLVAGAVIVGGILLALHSPQSQQVGVGTPDSAAQVATSSTIQVGPQQVKTIFAANTSCKSRIVGELQVSTTVILSFDSHVTPSASAGYPVAASTTAAFPANQYGCGAVRAYAAASTTITLTELIQ